MCALSCKSRSGLCWSEGQCWPLLVWRQGRGLPAGIDPGRRAPSPLSKVVKGAKRLPAYTMNNEAVEATINVYFCKSRRVRLGALLQTSSGQHRPPPPQKIGSRQTARPSRLQATGSKPHRGAPSGQPSRSPFRQP